MKFSTPASSKGTLYSEYDGTSKGSEKVSASDKFYVDPSSKQYGLDDVVFVPKTNGTIEFSYTAYPTKGSSFTGKVQVTVTAGTLKDITYTSRTTGGITFNGADFASALKSKSSSATLSYVTFTLPSSSMGTLYYDYNAASGRGTAVSSSTQYKNSTSGNSISKVTFVPKNGVTGTVTINYTAKDTRGNLYDGAVKVNITPGEDKVLTYSSNGRAVTFTNADFRLACSSKLGTTLNYVRFTLPNASQGTLYYGYRSNQETRVSANASYMSNTHLDFISFVPKANFSGTATITYTGYDVNGTSYTGTIQVQVTQPTRSSYFTDATESWIIPASDFLNAYGVYSGVVSGSTLGVRNQATRGEVMQMIYNAFNLQNKVTSVTSHFTDVPATHPYYTAINAANQLGIAQGDQGMFRPNEAITRQDAMTLLYRAFTVLNVPMSTGTAADLMTFSDYAKVDSYATNALASMVKSGIIQGDNGKINPKGNVTRGEISVMLYRAMTL